MAAGVLVRGDGNAYYRNLEFCRYWCVGCGAYCHTKVLDWQANTILLTVHGARRYVGATAECPVSAAHDGWLGKHGLPLETCKGRSTGLRRSPITGHLHLDPTAMRPPPKRCTVCQWMNWRGLPADGSSHRNGKVGPNKGTPCPPDWDDVSRQMKAELNSFRATLNPRAAPGPRPPLATDWGWAVERGPWNRMRPWTNPGGAGDELQCVPCDVPV